MKSASRVTVSTFGAIVGVAGIEHGIGEILQGNIPPSGIMIKSWPESDLYKILAHFTGYFQTHIFSMKVNMFIISSLRVFY